MRFSTIAAVSAIVLGVNAIANPDVVVYETQVVTITSCPPEKTACPAHSTTYIPVSTPAPETTAPEVTPTPEPTPEVEEPEVEEPEVEEPEVEEPETPEVPVETPVYGNGTIPATTPAPEVPEVPVTETPETPVETESPTTPTYPIATGTGVPSVPANTSVPVVPTSPPAFEGAGAKMGVSILAVAGAAVFALLA